MSSVRVVIVDSCPDRRLAGRLETALKQAGAESAGDGIRSVTIGSRGGDPVRVAASVRSSDPHLAFLCLVGGRRAEAQNLLTAVCAGGRGCPVLIAGDAMAPEEVCQLVERGATDFVLEPFSPVELATRLLRLRREAESVAERRPIGDFPAGLDHLLGENPRWRREVEKIPLLSGCGASVLIHGETGTGKELCARAIHQLGPRRDRPFTPLNCGAIPADLVENELFGHTTGAYTSAVSAATGIVQAADGGTLFLDEVDALPLGAQVKLLRFLQSREYRQVGGARLLQADVRIVAASNADLAEAVRSGRFRSDLYYRLNVMTLHLPALRERREDIPALARHFVERFAEEHRKPLAGLSPLAMQRLMAHDWPGNVRELENVLERAVIVARDSRLQTGDLSLAGRSESDEPRSFKDQKARAVAAFERSYLEQVLAAHGGNISQAARAAQKNRRAFWELLRKHGLRVEPRGPRDLG